MKNVFFNFTDMRGAGRGRRAAGPAAGLARRLLLPEPGRGKSARYQKTNLVSFTNFHIIKLGPRDRQRGRRGRVLGDGRLHEDARLRPERSGMDDSHLGFLKFGLNF